ncbi:hypothetical protein OROMI_020658 [Orobanche minor]
MFNQRKDVLTFDNRKTGSSVLSSQRDSGVTEVLAAAVQACHDMVPPDFVNPLLTCIVNKFLHDRARPEAIAVGLNTTREICSRMPLLNPSLLIKKDRGRQHAGSKAQPYGHVDVASDAPGLDSLKHPENNEGEYDDDDAEPSSDDIVASSDDEDDGLQITDSDSGSEDDNMISEDEDGDEIDDNHNDLSDEDEVEEEDDKGNTENDEEEFDNNDYANDGNSGVFEEISQ